MGVLSTHSQAHPGYPFGSVVPYCLDNGGFPLLLLSHLAQHTRNLMAEPRCALTLAKPTPGDVQQSTRLGCVADCRPLASQAEGARYFRYYPAARTYLEQLGFRLFRLEPIRFHLNAGFATARWVGRDRIRRPNRFGIDAELNLIAEIHAHRAGALLRLLQGTGRRPSPGKPPDIAGADPDGIDVRQEGELVRIPLPETAPSPAALLEVLDRT